MSTESFDPDKVLVVMSPKSRDNRCISWNECSLSVSDRAGMCMRGLLMDDSRPADWSSPAVSVAAMQSC